MGPSVRLLLCVLFAVRAPSLLRAQDTLHAKLHVVPIANNQSSLMFEGERADAVVAAVTTTTENGIQITRGHLNQPLAVWKWTVNGVENGNALYGKMTVDAASHAYYTAPGGDYYGPITIAATVKLPDGSQDISLCTVYVIPKYLRYTYCVAVGCKCYTGGGPIPHLINSQGIYFDFQLKRSSSETDVAESVIDIEPTAIPQAAENRHGESCEPIYSLSKLEWGKDLVMRNPHCTYHGSDNRLHFEIEGHNQDFPGFEMRLANGGQLMMTLPLSAAKETNWQPELNVSKLPTFETPDQRTELDGGIILKTKWKVEVLVNN